MSGLDGAQQTRVRPHRRWGWRLAFIAGALVAVWLAVTIGVRLAYTDRVLPATTMGGLSVGGRSPEAVRRLLTSTFATEQPVTIIAGGHRFVISAAEAGYRVDVPASAARARSAGRDGPLRGAWSTVASLLTARKLEPVAHVDRSRLAARIAVIAHSVDRPARAGALVADGAHVRALAPRAGRTLDRAAAVTAVVAALHDRRPGPVVLAVRTRVTATREEVQAVARRAREYLRTPVRLAGAPRPLTLTARQTARILALERTPRPGGGDLRLGVDAGRVKRLVDALARDLDGAPENARIRAPARPRVVLDGQGDLRWRPRPAAIAVHPSAPGRRLQQAAAAAAIADAVRGGRHTVTVEMTRASARVRTDAARRITSLLGTFTTRYPCCEPRVTNIRLIAKDVDGVVVLPGERFSLNQATGPRTRADGYVPAPFIADGKIVPSVGGGVSQFSTTLYNAAYFAGLRIDTRRPHSFYIARYPPGREATLNFGDIDLAWTNDTSTPVLIRTATDATSVVVSLYGADHGRRVRSQTGERTRLPGRDFAITVTRVLRYRDGRIARQPYTTRYDAPPPPE